MCLMKCNSTLREKLFFPNSERKENLSPGDSSAGSSSFLHIFDFHLKPALRQLRWTNVTSSGDEVVDACTHLKIQGAIRDRVKLYKCDHAKGLWRSVFDSRND